MRFNLKTGVLAALVLVFGTGCPATNPAGNSSAGSSSGTTTTSSPQTTIVTENGVAVIAATSSQCPSGGVVVQTYVDVNHDGTYDSGDTILSTTPICNGANGSNGTNGTNGLGAGIQVKPAASCQCAAGGVQITTFIDANNNGVLDSGEKTTSINTVCNGVNGANGADGNSFTISQTTATIGQCASGGVVYSVTEQNSSGAATGQPSTSIVCNGTTGATGATGASGLSGASVVFTTVAASTQECADGGSLLMLASDTAGTGLYTPTDANQQSITICNGQTGAQGAAGPVSAFSTVAPVMPCTANSSPWKEVLLCMADGSLLADFSADMSGAETRLSFIPAGEYEDTDSSGCIFSVSDDGAGGLTVAWGAGSNQYSSWTAGSYDCVATP